MNRSDLVDKLVAQLAHLPRSDVEVTVSTIIGAMSDSLVRGQRIEIRGFGSFSVNLMSPRLARNPRNGDSVCVPPTRKPHFKPGKTLREQVDKSGSGKSPPDLA